MSSGAVQKSFIIDVPSVVTSAWSDNYAEHNSTSVYESQANVTVSYGSLFMDALHHAAYCGSIDPWVYEYFDYHDEDLTDKTFNFRLPGLNLDYMSYAIFTLVQRHPQTLLDHMTLQTAAKYRFPTHRSYVAFRSTTHRQHTHYHQTTQIDPRPHFIINPPTINNNTTITTLPIINTAPITSDSDSSNGIPAPSYQDAEVRTSMDKTVEAIVHTPVNELVTSPTAVFLCLAILAFLACIAVLVYLPYAAYFKGLPRDVETLASTIAFVHDSPKLQEWVAANEHTLNPGEPATRRWETSNSERGDNSNLEADRDRAADGGLDGVTMGLGFFRGKQGVARWGVELEPVVYANPKRPSTTLVAGEDE